MPAASKSALNSVVVHLGEDVFEAPVVAFEDRVLGGHVHRVAAVQPVAQRGAGEVADRVVEVVHRQRHAAAGEVVDVELDRLAAVRGGEGERQLARAGNDHVGGAVLVAERVAADHDRLGPAGHQARDVGDHDRLAEDDPAEDVADRAVGRAVHLLQPKLLHARLVGGDRRALDTHPVALDRLGRLHRHLVGGGVAALDAEVVVRRARRPGRAGSAAP